MSERGVCECEPFVIGYMRAKGGQLRHPEQSLAQTKHRVGGKGKERSVRVVSHVRVQHCIGMLEPGAIIC